MLNSLFPHIHLAKQYFIPYTFFVNYKVYIITMYYTSKFVKIKILANFSVFNIFKCVKMSRFFTSTVIYYLYL